MWDANAAMHSVMGHCCSSERASLGTGNGRGWGGADTQREEFTEEAEGYGLRNGRPQSSPGGHRLGGWAKHFICIVLSRVTAALTRLLPSRGAQDAQQGPVKQEIQ